jgi:predicted small lipoprotein YifL
VKRILVTLGYLALASCGVKGPPLPPVPSSAEQSDRQAFSTPAPTPTPSSQPGAEP